MQYQLLPALTSDEYQALKDDIAERGVQVPIEFDEAGNVLDGHHRLQACAELGIKDYPSIIRPGLTEEQKQYHVLTLNLNRRHLTSDQRKELHATLRGLGWSLRKIAETTKVSHITVRHDLTGVNNLTPARTIGKDGKSYPSIVTKNNNEKQRVFQALSAAPLDLGEGMRDAKQVVRIARDEQLKQERAEMAAIAMAENSTKWQVFCADIKTWTPDKQYDFIITDPPYPKEYLELYEVMARRAVDFLKPGGLLIAMCGQSYLDIIMASMAHYLDYYWTGSYLTPGQPKPLQNRQVNTSWKPLLFFTLRGDKYNGKIFGDVFISDANDKSLHEWGQSEAGMLSIVSQVCLPGQTILDPFCGAGTTGIATLKHGCYFTGLDIQQENVNISKQRLNDETKE